MKYVYMNHRIRDDKPKGPVIVVQAPEGTREGDDFEIRYYGQPLGRVKFSPNGLTACDTHEVRAWIELDDDVEVVAVAKAKAKKPGKKVRV